MAIDPNSGYGDSAKFPFTIGNGADGSAVAVVDLGRNHAYVLVRCEDVTNAPASGTMVLHVTAEAAGTPVTLFVDSLEASQGVNATFHRLFFVGLAREVRIVLSGNATGDIVFDIWGIDAAADA